MVFHTGMICGRKGSRKLEERFLRASVMIESLRDNGYNNTAYALAELIDNSIQAGAERVELGFIEEQVGGAERKTYNVTEISVWDNGKGMSPDELQRAMQFGGSTNRLNPHGMGKFGMGLPNSSISQCRRVDVWSWVDGGEPHHTYLDIEEMKAEALENIPAPKIKQMPEKYRAAFFEQLPKSGTLVLWSKLDRLSWKTGRANFRNCEFLVGRMYRRYLESKEADDKKVKIFSMTYRPIDGKLKKVDEYIFSANDPMYLMKNTSLPSLPDKYIGQSFFELIDAVVLKIDFEDSNGERIHGDVEIRTSIVKNSIARYILETEDKSNLGQTEWGKHCAKNIGVSIMRAGRELVLRRGFISADIRQYQARFIGLEICFPPSLDRLFGVTNNKQDAVKLIPQDISMLSADANYDSEMEYLENIKIEDPSLYNLLTVIKELDSEFKKAKAKLKTITLDRKEFQTSAGGADEKATVGSGRREEEGYSATDKEQPEFSDVVNLIEETGKSGYEAVEIAKDILARGVNFHISTTPLDSDAFFDVSRKKGLTLVVFNSNHIFYKDFIAKLPEDQRIILETAIAGYARVMNETSNPGRVEFMNTIRRDWGKVITDFLDDSFTESEGL